MGTDEYMINSSYASYLQLLAYARVRFVTACDATGCLHRFHQPWIDNFVRSNGRTLRIWNDGLMGANTIPLHKDIVVEHWLPEPVTPQQLLDEGHTVVNATDALY